MILDRRQKTWCFLSAFKTFVYSLEKKKREMSLKRQKQRKCQIWFFKVSFTTKSIIFCE